VSRYDRIATAVFTDGHETAPKYIADLILLQKYFAQVIAGLDNAEIAVDPDGILLVGAEVKVPYDLNEGDTRCDVILLTPYADVPTSP
jgi:hypothetical protein